MPGFQRPLAHQLAAEIAVGVLYVIEGGELLVKATLERRPQYMLKHFGWESVGSVLCVYVRHVRTSCLGNNGTSYRQGDATTAG